MPTALTHSRRFTVRTRSDRGMTGHVPSHTGTETWAQKNTHTHRHENAGLPSDIYTNAHPQKKAAPVGASLRGAREATPGKIYVKQVWQPQLSLLHSHTHVLPAICLPVSAVWLITAAVFVAVSFCPVARSVYVSVCLRVSLFLFLPQNNTGNLVGTHCCAIRNRDRTILLMSERDRSSTWGYGALMPKTL